MSGVDAEALFCSRTRAQGHGVGPHVPLQLLPLVPCRFGCGRQQSTEFYGCKSKDKIVQKSLSQLPLREDIRYEKFLVRVSLSKLGSLVGALGPKRCQ